MIAAALAALSMVPICFTSAEQPDPPKAQPLALVEQFATAPAAVIGSFGAGLVNGGVLALAPLYAHSTTAPNAAAEFYSAAFDRLAAAAMAGGPHLRSRRSAPRHRGAHALAALASASRSRLSSGALPRLDRRCSCSCCGARARSRFYGIAVAHMADRAEPGKLAQSAAGLLFVWAAGSVIGP